MLLTPLARVYVFVLFFTLPALVMGLAAFGPVWMINRRKDEAWYERARYVYPFRRAVSALFGMELILGYLLCTMIQHRLGIGEDRWFMPLSFSGFCCGTLYSLFLIHRRIGGECPTFLNWLAEFATLFLVRLFTFVLVIGIGAALSTALPAEAAWSIAWLTAYAMSVAGFGLWILRLLRRLIPANPELVARAESIAAQMQVPPPHRVLVLKHRVANAFALPVLRQVIVTSRLLTELTPAEVDSIMAHEIGHLTESPGDTVKRIVSGMLFVPALIVALSHLSDIVPLLGSFVVIFVLRWFSSGLSQRLEKRADEIASRCQTTPGEYAEALLKLYRCNLSPAVFRKRDNRTHPDLYDRMTAAGSPPAFARPLPPLRSLYFVPFSFAIIVHSLLFVGLLILLPESPDPHQRNGINSNDHLTADDQDDGVDFGADDDGKESVNVLTPI